MDTNDKQHIEAICRRHDIHFLSKAEAMLLLLRKGQLMASLKGEDGSIGSFSSRLYSDQQGDAFRGIYIGREDLEQDGIDYFSDNEFQLDVDEHEYFVALHEIAHVILRHQGSPVAPLWRQCEEEIEAWEWAFAHAQYEPSDAVIIAALCACTSYTHREDAMLRGEVADDPAERLRPYRPEQNSVAA